MTTETVFECPKCKKNGMVRLHSDQDVFECIYCRYTTNLGEEEEPAEDGTNWFVVLLIGLFAALIATTL